MQSIPARALSDSAVAHIKPAMDSNKHSIIIPDEMGAGAKRSSKLRRSCESCRNLKTKCAPDEQTSSKCQRCVKDGQQCVFLEPKARVKRAKNSRIRVAEMEEKLDELMALVTSKQASQAEAPPEFPDGAAQSSVPFHLGEPNIEAFTYQFMPSNFISRPDGAEIQQSFPMFSFPNFEESFADVISNGLISLNKAQELVGLFQNAAIHFPFVVLPQNTVIDTLRREKPVLLLSILCSSSASNAKLQNRLELELREALSKRIIIHGEKSLDLLQGLLVYLAWYHFYFDVDRDQLYQFSQMAAAMVVDLEINTPGQDLRQSYEFDSNPQPSKQKMSSEELEERRTFLGSYFVTSSVCQGLRKPNSFQYDDYMDVCSQSLSQAARAETDHLIPYFIRLQQLAEEIDHAFEYSRKPKTLESAARIEILVKAFERQINQIQESFPSIIWKNNSITMRFHHLRSYVNRVGFHASKPSELDIDSRTTTFRSWYYSASRSDCLIRCLHATKDYLDRYLSLTPEDIGNFTFPDFILLFYAILILGAFTTEVGDSQTLDVAQMRQTVNLEYYVNALSSQTLQAVSLLPPGVNNYMRLLHALFLKSKLCYMSPRIVSLRGVERARSAIKSILPTMKSDEAELSGMTDTLAWYGQQWTETLPRWAPTTIQDLPAVEFDNYLLNPA